MRTACVALLVVAVALQVRMAALSLPLSLADPDSPAHFTTGVMAYEYLKSAFGSNPLAFAESFYVRFPKVALGQWPPAYYGVQAAWYFLFPTSPASARVLSAVIAATMAAVLFLRLRRGYGLLPASAAVALFLSLPAIQISAWVVMSDLLTGLFVLLAILSLSTFLEEPRRPRNAWWFALWSSLALLTKGSAFALVPFALLAPWFAWRPRCFGNIWYWASGVACGLVSSPFYILVTRMGLGYSLRGMGGGPDPHFSRLRAVTLLLRTAPPLVWTLVAFGFAAAVLSRRRSGSDRAPTTDALLAGAWLVTQALVLTLFPLTQERRVFIPALAPAAILVARCLQQLQWILRHRSISAVAAPVGLTLLCIATCEAAPVTRIEGYRAAADSIPYRQEGSLMLVSAGAQGDGAFISERLAHDPWRAGIIIRASRVLAESAWSGLHYRLLLNDAGEVRKYLIDLPVRYILIDDSTGPSPDQALLEEAIRTDPEDFALLGRFPIRVSTGRYLGEVRVYENRTAGDRRPAVVRVRLGAERGGRILEYRWR